MTTAPSHRRPSAGPARPGIGKRFPGVIANHDVDLDVRAGTVHALVGENGAGKSTLMKILYGVQKPDDGHHRASTASRSRSRRRPTPSRTGIGMVFQHFSWPTTSPSSRTSCSAPRSCTASATRPRSEIQRISDAYGFGLDPDELVETLGVGERQRVEILKVLYRGAKIIILDEPTAVLVPQEVDALFDNLRELKARGPHADLHLPQARRGARDRRRHHRAAPRHHGRHGQARRRSPRTSSPS